jgi:hypothetical protein
LMTFSIGTTWYFVGRGLSETVGAGFGFLAAFMLLRGRPWPGHPRSLPRGTFAVLMFYTRLNFGAGRRDAGGAAAAVERHDDGGPRDDRSRAPQSALARRDLRWLDRGGSCSSSCRGPGGTPATSACSMERASRTTISGCEWTPSLIRPSGAGFVTASPRLIFMNEPPHFDVRAFVGGAGVIVVCPRRHPGARAFAGLPLALRSSLRHLPERARCAYAQLSGPDVDSSSCPSPCAAAFTGAGLMLIEARIVNRLLPWLLLIVAAVAYTWRLGEMPTYLSPDEAMIAVDAHSVATTGRDLHGALMPLYFFIGDPKAERTSWFTPVIFYLSAGGAAGAAIFRIVRADAQRDRRDDQSGAAVRGCARGIR